MLYDRTCVPGKGLPLTWAWRAGGGLYGALGRFDAWYGAASWDDGLRWLAEHGEGAIEEIQYWGHGNWGRILIDRKPLDRLALRPGHPLHGHLAAIRERTSAGSLWWFRTCEAFGAEPGQAFARDWVDWFGCPAAGHTHVIGPWQSGLHLLRPGEAPWWSPTEGLAAGTPAEPRAALGSWPWMPYTVSCLQGTVPESCVAPR